VRAHDLSELCGAEIWSKLEILQPTGAFKLRGATNTILQLNEDERELIVAVGKNGTNNPASEALDYVFAYSVGLDLTRRDLQK